MSGGVATQLTPWFSTEQAPDWSPDGSHISFQSSHLGHGLWIIPAAGGTPTRITSDMDWHPSWSPDGAQLAFESVVSGNWDIWVTDAGAGACRGRHLGSDQGALSLDDPVGDPARTGGSQKPRLPSLRAIKPNPDSSTGVEVAHIPFEQEVPEIGVPVAWD